MPTHNLQEQASRRRRTTEELELKLGGRRGPRADSLRRRATRKTTASTLEKIEGADLRRAEEAMERRVSARLSKELAADFKKLMVGGARPSN